MAIAAFESRREETASFSILVVYLTFYVVGSEYDRTGSLPKCTTHIRVVLGYFYEKSIVDLGFLAMLLNKKEKSNQTKTKNEPKRKQNKIKQNETEEHKLLEGTIVRLDIGLMFLNKRRFVVVVPMELFCTHESSSATG